jgi:hypothetical protein
LPSPRQQRGNGRSVQQGMRYVTGHLRTSLLTLTPGPRKYKGAVLRVLRSLSAPRQRRDDRKAVQLGVYTTAPPRARFAHTFPRFFSVSHTVVIVACCCRRLAQRSLLAASLAFPAERRRVRREPTVSHPCKGWTSASTQSGLCPARFAISTPGIPFFFVFSPKKPF